MSAFSFSVRQSSDRRESPQTAHGVGDLAGPGLKRTIGIGGSMSIDCSTMTTDAAAPVIDCARAGEWLTQPLESDKHTKTDLVHSLRCGR